MAKRAASDSFKNISITKKQAQTIVIIALILISGFLSIHFRSYPAKLPAADEWAENSLRQNLRNQITAGINQQYPNLPPERKQALIDEQLATIIAEQGQEIENQAKQQGEYIRQRLQDDDGQTYLLAIDPYLYLRRAQNIVETGTICDDIKDGVCWNDHMLAPIGKPMAKSAHASIGAAIYRIVDAFSDPRSVLAVFFWLPVIISSLAVIPAFFLARKRAGNVGGFIAAMIVAIHPVFLGRTAAGFSDTDAYTVLFPLFIFWMFIEAFEAKDLKEKLIYSGLTGLLIGIYGLFWEWWLHFDLMLGVIIIALAFYLTKTWIKEKSIHRAIRNKEVKREAITMLGILVSTGIFVSLIHSFRTFITSPIGSAVGRTSIQRAAHSNLWPNVFTTVAELNRASIASVVGQVGGNIYFYLACLGIILSIIKVKEFKNKDWIILGGGAFVYLLLITKPILNSNPFVFLTILILPVAAALLLLLTDDREMDVKYAIFLTIWFAGTIYASTQGVRFILLLVPAYAVAFGIFAGQTYKLITNWSHKQWEVDQTWIRTGLIILALLLLISPLRAANNTAMNEVPSMNDAWWASLKKIDQEAAPNAIINSWWDFGHWFKYVADRAVTFDGASQNTPMAHWVGKALSTDNEAEAIGILRMLDCGSQQGFDTLAKHMQGTDTITEVEPRTTLKAKMVMDEAILIEEQSQAQEHYEQAGLTTAQAQEVASLTHCEPPENYFITSGDMIGKASVWGHFGSWDFRKAYAYTNLRRQPIDQATPIIAELFNISSQEAAQLYHDALTLPNEQQANAWISPWPQYLMRRATTCQEENGMLACAINSGIGTQQGQNLVLEKATVPLDDLESSTFTIGAYQPSTGQRLGGNDIAINAVIVLKDGETNKAKFENPVLNFDLFIVEQEGNYLAMAASPELASSMFTRLFFMEGAGTEQFEKFSDETSPITGDRIIVWKVKW